MSDGRQLELSAIVGTIDIRPSSSVYATYQRLSYQPWYALAEFVDNSTASYIKHREVLLDTYRVEHLTKCRIEINYDHNAQRLVIKDNAFGMEYADFARAIVLDQPPVDRSGRNEFGMGLKTAASWFGSRWTIETTQLGSTQLYRTTMDVRHLAQTKQESIKYTVQHVLPSSHGTVLTIEGVHQPIVGRAHERVREQLRSIYRSDLRSGEVEILYQGKPLTYEEPELLREGQKTWRQDLNLEVTWERTGKTLPVTGWVGIRKTMSRRDSGFVLMRRGRVILGGPDHGYRPADICGTAQTHEYGRIVGELNLDDWPVNQAKDGFNWNDGLEDEFIKVLEKACQEITRKARTHRVIVDDPRPPSPDQMKAAAEPIQQVIRTEPFRRYAAAELSDHRSDDPESVSSESTPPPGPSSPYLEPMPIQDPESLHQTPDRDYPSRQPIEYLLDMGQEQWLLLLHWYQSLPDQFWMSLQHPRPARGNEPQGAQVVEITLNMAHPFLAPYLHNQSSLDVLQRLVFSLALSETIVRAQAGTGRVEPGAVRMKMNDVLRYAAQAEREC